MIAKTLLTPEDFTNAGVRFQFIQNEIIRVQRDDLIATFTEPCIQWVPLHSTSSLDTVNVSIGANNININVTRQLSQSVDFSLRTNDPVLNAYVSGMYTSETFFEKKLQILFKGSLVSAIYFLL